MGTGRALGVSSSPNSRADLCGCSHHRSTFQMRQEGRGTNPMHTATRQKEAEPTLNTSRFPQGRLCLPAPPSPSQPSSPGLLAGTLASKCVWSLELAPWSLTIPGRLLVPEMRQARLSHVSQMGDLPLLPRACSVDLKEVTPFRLCRPEPWASHGSLKFHEWPQDLSNQDTFTVCSGS